MIVTHSSFNTDKLFTYAWKGAIVCGGAIILTFILFFLFPLSNGKSVSTFSKGKSVPETENKPYYEAIGSGPLSLNEGQLSKFLHSIRKELIVLAKNTRPDVASGKADLLIGLKNAGEEKVISSESVVYLEKKESLESDAPVYHFSDKETPLWFKPISYDQASIAIEVGGEVEEEQGKFFAKSLIDQDFNDKLKDAQPFKTLKEMEWCGSDRFLETYGKEEYKSVLNKHKVLFKEERSSYACFVQQGDYLVWEDGKWKVRNLEEIAPDANLALIKSITPYEIEVLGWDEKGFFPFHVKIAKKDVPRISLKMEEIITSTRLRTASQVSCMFGKKRMVIKPGDWLLKTALGWHKLRRLSEIEDYLDHKLEGMLFVFDTLNKEGGKMVIQGQLFDEKRSQVANVSIPVNEEKKMQSKKKDKKAPLVPNGNRK